MRIIDLLGLYMGNRQISQYAFSDTLANDVLCDNTHHYDKLDLNMLETVRKNIIDLNRHYLHILVEHIIIAITYIIRLDQSMAEHIQTIQFYKSGILIYKIVIDNAVTPVVHKQCNLDILFVTK